MNAKENRIIRPVNGIGPGATIGARKLAEQRAEKLAQGRRDDELLAALLGPDWHAQAQRELDAAAMGEESDP